MCFHEREQILSLQIQMDQSDYDDWKVQQGGREKFHQKQKFPRRILQFVCSVSVLSFLLWYSFGFSILPHDESMNAFFSTFLFSIFSHILERKYMFLLCNAILAFLVKTSLSISDTDIDNDDSLQAANLSDTNAIPVSMEDPSLMDEEQETDKEQVSAEEDDDGENIEVSSTAKEEDEQVGTTGEVMVGTQDDEGDDDTAVAVESEELSNADELNRKFEEFIRKMKEEIRIEAQLQLIAAV